MPEKCHQRKSASLVVPSCADAVVSPTLKLPFLWIGYRLGDFLEIVGLSISVSLAATAIAAGRGFAPGGGRAAFLFLCGWALVHRASEKAWARYGDELTSDGATRLQAVPQTLMIIRADLVTAILAGFGRTVSEVGAVILVGGNIRGLTRARPQLGDSQEYSGVIHKRSADSELTDAPLRP